MKKYIAVLELEDEDEIFDAKVSYMYHSTDRFKECFERVLFDCKAWDYVGTSGNYEHETLEMLLDAFNEAVVLPKGHGNLVDTNELIENGVATKSYLNTFIKTIIEADKEEENESVS